MGHLVNRIKILREISSVAPNVRARGKLLAVTLYLFFFEASGRRRAFDVRVMVCGKPITLTVHSIAHIWSLRDILAEGEYNINGVPDVGTVIDLGSNIGVSVAYFACRYPQARIIAVEANPRTVELLKKNTVQFANVEVVSVAIGEQDGEVSFYAGEYDTGASLWKRNDESTLNTVRAVTLPTLLAELQVSHTDILKFDIEGAERYVFPYIPKVSVTCWLGEIHYDMIAQTPSAVASSFEGYKYSEHMIAAKRSIIQALDV